MPQTFSKAQALYIRLAIIAAMILIAAAILAWRATIGYASRLNEAVQQPIPFSHKHHVGDDGLDCRYCHTSVETSATAGMPATEICMTCHSRLFTQEPVLQPVVQSFTRGLPLQWNRVYDLPDFVYFNHSIHVQKGVGCVVCHGQVDAMPLIARVAPLTMQWCLGCHRKPAMHLRPKAYVFDLHWQPPPERAALGARLMREYAIDTQHLTDCSICHR